MNVFSPEERNETVSLLAFKREKADALGLEFESRIPSDSLFFPQPRAHGRAVERAHGNRGSVS